VDSGRIVATGRDIVAGIDAHVRRQARRWAVGCQIVWRFIEHPVSY
jgi:hypothetical protein